MTRVTTALALTLLTTSALAADPVKIGITTILSGPFADGGQSEQYGAQLALDKINQAGGVLGRPVEAFYGDNACDPKVGVPATKRLIEQEHVPVLIGALCTPVTHAIEPVVKDAKIPLIIATSAGQDFVDASGVGGNPYLWKTIPTEIDMPTQRPFFVYQAVLLAVDAIKRANPDTPDAIEAALETTAMPSGLGGTYAPDDHNHARTPLDILGVRDGKVAVIATE